MIKLKLLEIVNAKPAFDSLVKLHLPMATAFNLAKRLKVINTELEIYTAKRDELVKAHGEALPDKPGAVGVLPGMKGFEEFIRLHAELLAVEVELAMDPLTLDELTKGSDKNTLSTADAMALAPFMAAE